MPRFYDHGPAVAAIASGGPKMTRAAAVQALTAFSPVARGAFNNSFVYKQ